MNRKCSVFEARAARHASEVFAFERRDLAPPQPITLAILRYTLGFQNIRLDFSRLFVIIYFIKSQKLTINHVINLRHGCVFPVAD
jgi:hypothetical protein